VRSASPALALALALLVPAGSAAGDAATRELSVLSYNLHALHPWAARDDPETRMQAIGPRLRGYDVALLQESWLFHETLAGAAGDPPGRFGNGPASDWAEWFSIVCGRCGSGLAVVLPGLPEDAIVASEAEGFGLCSGWLDNGNDCFANKGWLWLRLRLAPGLELDVVDTHLDAGSGTEDQDVRARQLERLEAFLAFRSGGHALVVGGDLNLDHDDPDERAPLDRFARALGLEDSGARPADTDRFRRIDWILYRSGDRVRLEPIAAGEAEGFATEGRPLSDHPAIEARFRVSAPDPDPH